MFQITFNFLSWFLDRLKLCFSLSTLILIDCKKKRKSLTVKNYNKTLFVKKIITYFLAFLLISVGYINKICCMICDVYPWLEQFLGLFLGIFCRLSCSCKTEISFIIDIYFTVYTQTILLWHRMLVDVLD